MIDAWDGRPQNPERDSEGHVWRVDGCVDVYKWVAENLWYADRKGRWFVPEDALADGDIYFGRIVTPAEVSAQIEAARREEREACARIVEGRVYREQYRTWPWWINRDGSEGNRSSASDIVQHADKIAAAIRARGDV